MDWTPTWHSQLPVLLFLTFTAVPGRDPDGPLSPCPVWPGRDRGVGGGSGGSWGSALLLQASQGQKGHFREQTALDVEKEKREERFQ